MDLGKTLLWLGVTPNYKGYHQTLCATRLAAEKPDSLMLVTKHLYPTVASRCSTSWQAVERNIRQATDRAWRCNPGLLSRLAGRELAQKPTAAQFIAILAASESRWDGQGEAAV